MSSVERSHTTIQGDPEGAAAFLRNLKVLREGEEVRFKPLEYEVDWFTRSSEEVRERLGRDSLWSNPSPVGIGFDYETLVGVNIGGTHKVIDDVRAYDRIVTSMKTMDTHAFSYGYSDRIISKGKEYINAFDNFLGVKTSDGFELPADQIQGFHLEIAVRTDMTQGQREAFKNIQEYGQEKGVRVIIAEVP